MDFHKTDISTKCYAARTRQEFKYQKAKYSKVGLSNFKSGKWYELVVRVMNENVVFYRKENGKIVKMVSYEIAPGSDYVDFLFVGDRVELAEHEVVRLSRSNSSV